VDRKPIRGLLSSRILAHSEESLLSRSSAITTLSLLALVKFKVVAEYGLTSALQSLRCEMELIEHILF
jgi:hypothetical protein